MPKFRYINGQLPTPEEFARQLAEAREKYDPLEELLSLERDLMLREQRHGLSSADFYRVFWPERGGILPK